MSARPAAAPRSRARPSRRWTQDPAGRRERILDAATREFARRGYADTRLLAIAKRAGVAEGTVYHAFGSKQGLLRAVGERYGRGLVEAAFGGLPPEPTPDDARGVIGAIFAYVRRTRASLGAFVLAGQPGEAGAARSATREQMVAALETRFARWSEAGSIAPVDAAVGAQLVFGLTERALHDCFLREGGRDEERWVAETTRVIERYLGGG